MSRKATIDAVIEWTPSGVDVADKVSQRTVSASSLTGIDSFISGKRVVVAVGRLHAFVRSIRVPDAPREQILQMLRLSLSNYVPVSATEAAYDIKLLHDVNGDGRLVVLSAVKLETLERLKAEAAEAKVTVERVIPAAYVGWAYALSQGMSDVAVVGRSREGMWLDVIIGGELRYSRPLPPIEAEEDLDAEIARTLSAAGAPHLTVLRGVSEEQALTALTEALPKFEIDLVEPKEMAARAKKHAVTLRRRALIFAMAAIAMGALAFDAYDQASSARNSANKRWDATLGKLRSNKDLIETNYNKISKNQKALNLAFNQAQPFSDVLYVWSKMAPNGLWLTGATLERGKSALIRGTAIDHNQLAAYVSALSASDRFRDVRLVFANDSKIEETPIVQFSITMRVIGNLPLAEKETKVAPKPAAQPKEPS